MTLNFQQAVEKAMDFFKKSGYPFARLEEAYQKDDKWIIRANVGITITDIREVTINYNGYVENFKKIK